MSTSKITVFTVPTSGTDLSLVLPIASSRVEKVQIAGTDIILLLRGGEQVLLKGAALQAVVNPAFKIVFSDREAEAVELINAAGAVQFTETSPRSVVANLLDAKGKKPGADLPDEAAEQRNPDQSSPESVLPSQVQALAGITPPNLSAVYSQEASAADKPLPPPSLIVVAASGSGNNNGTPGEAPPPRPPADTISISATVRNLTGSTSSAIDGGGLRIQGSAGSAESATDLSPTAQSARELLIGSSGNDLIDGDGGGNMGSGFARLLTIQASARADLSVSTLAISGLPSDFEVVGAVRSGSSWLVTLPPDLAERGNSVTLMLKYPVAQDGVPFAETAFDLRITATGVLEGKDITGFTSIPAVLRDVRSSADLDYSVAGKNGVVFAAFGLGDDIRAGAGNDTIKAMVGHDRVLAGDGDDIIDGGAGDDTIEGGAGADSITGGTGVDTAVYASSDAAVEIDLLAATATGGEATGDTLVSIENLEGSAYSDRLAGTATANRLQGGEGNDWLIGRGGADRLDGGEGIDTADYAGSDGGVTVNLADGAGSGGDAEGDVLTGIENLVGSAFNDVLIGSAEANTLEAGAGNDTLRGGAGADVLKGGAGTDVASYIGSAQGVAVSLQTGKGSAGDASGDLLQDIENLTGSAQADELIGNGLANRLDGARGDDLLEGGAGADELIGGEGSDTAGYLHASTAVTVSLADTSLNTGDAAGDTFSGIENLEGSELGDTLLGDAADNILLGNPGDDQLSGAAGADVLRGGAGSDNLDGGDGADTASYEGSSEGVTVSLLAGIAGLGGDAQGDTLQRIENLLGSRFSDRLVGDAGANRLNGERGSDTLIGGAGADQLIGGEGSDTVEYTGSAAVTINLTTSTASGGDAQGDTFDSIENVVGSGGADTLIGDGAANTLEGGAGADTLEGLLGNDTLIGGDGDDTLDGGAGGDSIQGGAGTDRLTYAASTSGVSANLTTGLGAGGDAEGDTLTGIENITGSAFDDTLIGDVGSNLLSGGAGNDALEGREGADVLDGGAGSDSARYASALAGVIASLSATGSNTGEAAGDVYVSIEGLIGSNFDDALTGDAAANALEGGAGNDVLTGLGGADTLIGGAGQDTADYFGSDAAVAINLRQATAAGGHALGDTLQGIESLRGSLFADTLIGDNSANTLAGEAGNDLLMGGQGADTLMGGLGSDTASYADAQGAVVARLDLGSADDGDTLDSIENLIGSSFDDELAGNAADNQLEGGEGDDLLVGGGGADRLWGGGGSDTVSYHWSTAGITASLANPADNAGGAAGNTFDSIENLTGSALADLLVGNGSFNRLDGGAGDDTLVGGVGADTLIGGAGSDTAVYAASSNGVIVDLTTGKGTGGDAQGDTLAGVENLIGSAGGDTLIGNSVANRLEGGEGADVLDGRAGKDTMLGGDGDDIYVVDNPDDVVTETAGQGTDLVRSVVSHMLANHIENLELAPGAGDIDGFGNAAVNAITGNEGNNLLDGGAGADTLKGGDGNDTYVVDNPSDTVFEDEGAGTDTVQASVSHQLAGNVENLTLTGDQAINGTGNTLANLLIGNSAANILDGGSGADTMAGGAGDDIYLVGQVGDQVNENLGAGTDTVRARVSYTLGANLENLVLQGTDPISGTGNALPNQITGNDADNTLNGAAGDDTLTGGLGNDIYIVDETGDVVFEDAAGGYDTVRSSVSLTLSAEIEELVLTGAALNGTGNALNNVISVEGSARSNVLNGGVGADVMQGGDGNDTYFVDNTGDQVIEVGGQGTDTVFASVSYTLLPDVENLTLTGSGNLNGTGNDDNNTIFGTPGNNILDGMGGADTLIGGAGNDTYRVDNASDNITEFDDPDQGYDTVESTVSYTLTGGLEALILLGANNVQGTGNDGKNLLIGNDGNNRLDGGADADVMEGGAGDDIYIVDNAADQVFENLNRGYDTVRARVSYTLGANLERLELEGTGNTSGTGNGLANVIVGNLGNNILDGGGGSGDQLIGGFGDDTYIVSAANTTLTEEAGEGFDTVLSTVTWTLGDAFELLQLTGTNAIDGTGNGGSNMLVGNSAANVLNGLGGDDVLIGHSGDDTYVVDSSGDSITEQSGGGTDTVEASITWVLGSDSHLENLKLTGTAAINATGNGLNNSIWGNAGDNILDGGAGADTLAGGGGNDTYYITEAGDTILEAFQGGVADRVIASVGFALSAEVEILELTGSADLWGTGNNLANTIFGNSGKNTLDGGGGADTLVGGSGDDTYIVDDAQDNVIETSATDRDLIIASASYTLRALVEDLQLSGTGNINGTGNALDNHLTGNDGDNILDGGVGNDTLKGGKGNDTYVVDSAGDIIVELDGEGSDTVVANSDFTLTGSLENLTLQGTGNFTATGSGVNNVINGNAGNNIIIGGVGADTMAGGDGDDEYHVDNPDDRAVEASLEGGNDVVYSSVSFTLEPFIERLELLGAESLNGTGNAIANTLIGTVGNNILDGQGGADVMIGGLGNDIYRVDNAGDQTLENNFEGTDTVRSTVNYVLANHVENLELVEGAGPISGSGNSAANQITGNSQANVLYGGGGADTFFAGGGNDRIILVDNAHTLANGGAGRDTLALDRAGLNSLDQLVDKVSAIERLDFASFTLDGVAPAAHANTFRIKPGALNTPGLLGADAGGRLEVVGDSPSGNLAGDVLLLSSADFKDLFSNNAPIVTMADGSDGRLFASVVDSQHDLVVGLNITVLAEGDELASGWGLTYTGGVRALPSSFGGLRTWLDATDVDGDGVSEGAGEAGLVQSGTALFVSTWADKSGNSVTFTPHNGSSSWRPTWQAAGVTGQAAVRFDGSDQLVSSLTLPNHSYSVFAVGQLTDINGVRQAGRLVAARDTNWTLGWTSGLQDVASPGAGWFAYPIPLVPATYNSALSYGVVSYGPSGLAYRDGTVLAPWGAVGGTLGTLSLGAHGQAGSPSRGELSEVLVFDRALVDAERLLVEAYLRSKWLTPTPPPAVDPLLGEVGFDPTWFDALRVFGDGNANLNDTLTADYGTAPVRGAGKLDLLLLGGAGNDTLTGGERNDALFGHTGNDTLIGGAGTNYLAGGAGDDTYVVSSLTDTVFEAADAGTDLVQASVSYYLAAHVENLTLTGSAALDGAGNDGANVITGNAGANRLVGAGGNDTLIGGAGNDVLEGGAGQDTMIGGSGNDVYIADSEDVIQELPDGGTDTVLTYAALSGGLPANVENASAIGLTPITLTGNSGANTLSAGAPGSAVNAPVAHTLEGLGGDDVYQFSGRNVIHTVIEADGGGIDTVIFSNHDDGTLPTYVLPAHVENVDLRAAHRWSATGNALNNTLWGTLGSWENYFNGARAGNGARLTLAGLAGSDTYFVYHMYMRVLEIDNAGAGTDVDTVVAALSYRLLPNFENLTLAAGSQQRDTAGLKAWGNAANNTLTGNEFNNWLDGAGGTDLLVGGAGDDNYVIDDSTDTITETSTGGQDTVNTSLATLNLNDTKYANVENLVFTGNLGATGTGSAANNLLAGTTGNDTLSGNAGNDVLYGRGGTDTLAGGDGNDQLRSGFRPLPERPWVDGGPAAGLRLEVYTAINHMVPQAVATHTGGLSLNYGANVPPLPNTPSNGYGVQLVGDLTVATAGWYTFRSVSTAMALTIDGQRVLAYNYGDEGRQGQLETVFSLPVWLEAGLLPISVRANDPGMVGIATQLDIRWQRSDTYDAALANTTFSVIPTELFTYGQATPSDTTGDTLQGGAGDDYLEGAGGTDTLVGGTGNDTYVVQSAADTVTELAGSSEGTADTLMATTGLNLSLENYAHVENLTLIGSGPQNGTGSAGDNTLIGTAAANVLSGLGGNDSLLGNGGADTLNGGDGNDVLQAASGSTLNGDAGDDTLTVLDPWTPALLPGAGRLSVWLDAADLDGDGIREGLAEAGLNGNLVTLWRDKSGNGRHAEVYGEQQSPLLVQGALNGLPSVTFDGVDDYIAVPGVPSASTLTQSLYWVQNTTDSVYDIGTGRISAPTSSAWMLAANSGWTSPFGISGGYGVLQANAFWQNGAVPAWPTSSAVHASLNGITATVGVVNQTFDFPGGIQFGAAHNQQWRGHSTGIWNFSGRIPEVLVVSGALSVDERQFMEGYLAWKWGSQALLPAAHPYRNAAPQLATTPNGATLHGGAGNDTLTGGMNGDTLNGGTGADAMAGGAGNDTYVVDDAGDSVTEAPGAGIDTVQSSVSFSLGGTLENLVLTGTANTNATGNAMANVLEGNDGDNVLDGLGGADTMTGGAGNDTYVVDDAGDAVTEAPGAGTDAVIASVNHTLADHVENLTLVGGAPLNGTGNGLNNLIVGNQGNNVLDGDAGNDTLVSGGGVDTLHGGLGDDRLEFNAEAHIGLADGGSGTDTLDLGTVGGALDLGTLADRVDNLERLDLRDVDSDNITVDVNAIIGMTDSDAVLNLSLDSGDVLTITSPFVVGGSGVDPNTGETYTAYLLNSGSVTATLNVYLPPPPEPGP